ncbi:Fe-S cluster assembly ATPase SufC, partial [Candidatus Woesearchaeota archaeon CG_4_10_14_0_8_um_filter_47_5]
EKGKVHALMGPNGSGKSTLANVLMGHPKYEVTSGKIFFQGEDITDMPADERARKGLFLSFQYPAEIGGVTLSNFLRTALNAQRPEGQKMSVLEFKRLAEEKMKLLKMDQKFLFRYLNEGFSGGEKKRAEILQMLVLDPILAILDETDSGLDIDALRSVSEGINTFRSSVKGSARGGENQNSEKQKNEKALLIITHYRRILDYVKPDKLFIMIDGRIALEGSGALVDELEEKGYAWIDEGE